ncbi:NEQ345a [Nanoarchaeum equitans Kin4-M]|uniref:Bifunctional methyltransferase-like/endonuclease n=1 Tax=Nanoarchaeum equitans (strain Kin4-M) TaxID=228908 RepID=NFI_NANEQ|nr:RecName: Full=Bifunctional methyltransferase-like/endonuclease; Includes: RecName: Full=Probable methylated-DNA--protein-cysteine methyltransferase-like; Includes: RecName: Full=Endonuclease V; AltName: Full=Deoxyinosine 3'endonuclease; AltName: Full=Deoxyribonuclease V; Short=DNase V [Nanoarchaeum equitans Kin4-M]AAR39194.1 NEQ345a [Nanoarchaeum equitans Kin4-M]
MLSSKLLDINYWNKFGKRLINELINLIEQIPKGYVTTFKELAKALGDPIATKFVAMYYKKAPHWYRVVSSNLIVSPMQKALLEKEVKIIGNKVYAPIFKDFKSSKPLLELQKIQEYLVNKIKFDYPEYDYVIGIDIGYKNNIIALAIFDKNKKLIETKTCKHNIEFPYIPTYLSFREGIPIVNILKDLDYTALYIINGHGLSHPRKMGLATFVGTVLDLPTIGDAKKLLYGKIKNNIIYAHNMPVGYFVGHYVTIGNRTNLEFLKEFIKEWNSKKYLLPIEVADKITKCGRGDSNPGRD